MYKRQTTNSATVVSSAEVNGWSKATPHNQQLGSDTSGDAGLSDATKPQAKKRPTIIKRSRTDATSTSEQPAISTDEIQPPSQSLVEVSHRNAAAVIQSTESPTGVVLDRSEDRGSLPAAGQGPEDHDLKPIPRSKSLLHHSTEQELNCKIPPSKPPPPTLSNAVEERKAPM